MEAHSRKAIAESLLFAEKENLDIIITGGTDAWKLADELKTRNVPVIVGPVIRNPLSDSDPSDAPYANPGRLFEAGVKFCIRSDNAANSRNAPLEAAMAVTYGLPQAEGLKAVTLAAAEILGIENEVGSLTPKKSANLVILDGDPLEHTSNIKGVFIAGKPFAPDSRQIRFYARYRERLTEKKPATVQTNGETKAVAE
jgi:imidazolonepropionase-like amidohydrolase